MSAKECWLTGIPTLRLTCSLMKYVVWQNSAGAKTTLTYTGGSREWCREAACYIGAFVHVQVDNQVQEGTPIMCNAWPSRVRFCLQNQTPPSDPLTRLAAAVVIPYRFPPTYVVPGLHLACSNNEWMHTSEVVDMFLKHMFKAGEEDISKYIAWDWKKSYWSVADPWLPTACSKPTQRTLSLSSSDTSSLGA